MCASVDDKKSTKKYLVTFVPSQGTAWVGRKFTINIHPGKKEKYPDWSDNAGKRYVPRAWNITLNSGDAVVLDQDAFDWYNDPDVSGVLKDKTLVVEEIAGDNPLSKEQPGKIVKGHIVKDESWTVPAPKGAPFKLVDGQYMMPQGV